MTDVGISQAGARRYLILRSGLGIARGCRERWPAPDLTLAAIRTLEYVQVDPMRVLACNHQLVLAARVACFRPEHLNALLYRDRAVVEVVGRNRVIVYCRSMNGGQDCQ